MTSFREMIAALARRALGAPTVQTVRVTMKDVALRQQQSLCWIGLGDNATTDTSGFQLDLYAAGSHPGVIEFVQLIMVNQTRSPGPTGVDEELSSDGEWVLDTRDPYGNLRFQVVNGRPTEAQMVDSPGTELVRALVTVPPMAAGAFERVTVDDRFRTFIMWRPAAPRNWLRVPLGYIEWSWRGVAEVTEEGGECTCTSNVATATTSQWRRTSPADARAHTEHISAPKRPQWTRTHKELAWRPKT